MSRKVDRILHVNLLRDTLANCAERSGANDEYCKGITLATVGMLMAIGQSFPDAYATMRANLPSDCRPQERCIPAAWLHES